MIGSFPISLHGVMALQNFIICIWSFLAPNNYYYTEHMCSDLFILFCGLGVCLRTWCFACWSVCWCAVGLVFLLLTFSFFLFWSLTFFCRFWFWTLFWFCLLWCWWCWCWTFLFCSWSFCSFCLLLSFVSLCLVFSFDLLCALVAWTFVCCCCCYCCMG